MLMPVNLFYCYAHEDEELLTRLKPHLSPLQRQGLIDVWYSREISPGTEWEREIDKHLNAAQIILLLVSPDFMNSDYCYGIEMKRAMERHELGEAHVIPVILRPVDWQGAPFSKLQALPKNAQAVITWKDIDEAFVDVAKGVRKKVEEWRIAQQRTDEEWVHEAWTLNGLGQHDEAVVACERAIQLNPSNANAYGNMGWALAGLRRYEDAVVACNRAISLGTRDPNTYSNMSWALNALNRHEEALAASNEAIRLDPLNPLSTNAYNNKAWALNALNRHEEALAASNEAIRLDPTNFYAYDQKKWALDTLGQHTEAITTMKEALAVCDMTIELNPTKAILYSHKERFLNALVRYPEANEAKKKAKELGYSK
jgi:tetratricopeptide (TPR) repeat protein